MRRPPCRSGPAHSSQKEIKAILKCIEQCLPLLKFDMDCSHPETAPDMLVSRTKRAQCNALCKALQLPKLRQDLSQPHNAQWRQRLATWRRLACSSEWQTACLKTFARNPEQKMNLLQILPLGKLASRFPP
jgi:hypothetical protein